MNKAKAIGWKATYRYSDGGEATANITCDDFGGDAAIAIEDADDKATVYIRGETQTAELIAGILAAATQFGWSISDIEDMAGITCEQAE